MKYRNLVLLSFYFLSGMVFYCCGQNVECKEGINLLPMYGKVQKCKRQLESDKEFLSLSDKEEPNRSKAAIKMMDAGWYYLHQGDYDTAMKRMNQAWLLDSTNVIIFASFAVILDLTQKPDEAIKMLDITFEKIEARKNPETPTQMDPSNEDFIEFVINNAPFTYKKTNNSGVGKYLFGKLDNLDISELDKARFKDKLKTDIPEIN